MPAALLLLFVLACAAPPSEPPPTATLPVAPSAPIDRTARTVTLAEGQFGYCGRTIAFPATVQKLTELLGPPSRSENRSNTIDTWDDLGLCAYRKSGSDEIFEINVALARQDRGFSPRTPFGGHVVLPGGVIDRSSTPVDLRSAGLRERVPAMHGWEQRLGRFTVGAQCEDGVEELWFSWRGPAPQHVTGPPLGEDELFTAEARAYGFPFDETVREISHRGNVSVLRVEGARSEGSVGRSFFVTGATSEIARRRGFGWMVLLEAGFGSADMIVGFTDEEEPDVAREFPQHAVVGTRYMVVAADMILDLLPNWPDGGVTADAASTSR